MTKRKPWSDFVAKHGKQFPLPFKFSELADEKPDVTLGRCYFNSAMHVYFKPGCTYVEGCAQGVEHAWVEDEEGRVIETTWPHVMMQLNPSPIEYFGVPFRTEWFIDVVDKRGGLMVVRDGERWTLPSLQYLIFDRLGWRATAAGVKRSAGALEGKQ